MLIVSATRNNEIARRFLYSTFFLFLANLLTNIEHYNFATVWKNTFFPLKDSRLLLYGAGLITLMSTMIPQRSRSTYLIMVPNLIYF